MRAHFRRVGGVVTGVLLVTGALSAPAQAEPASLSGTLTSDATGEPIQGCATVYTADTYEYAGSGCSDESGRWVADGLETGVGYKVQFYSYDSIYGSEWSQDSSDFDSAMIHFAPETIDATLAYSREVGEEEISGVVTSEETGAPIVACVDVYDAASGDAIASTCTEMDGSWSVGRLPARDYKVQVTAFDGTHVGEWAQDAASFEAATAYQAPAQVDVALAPGGLLEGTLTRADGYPADYVSVSVYAVDDEDPTESEAWVSTDGDGNWQALVPPGDYRVRFHNWPADQWAFGQEREETATVLSVQVGQTVRVDDQFLGRVNVSGTVSADATGEGVAGACVTVRTRESYPDGEVAGYGCADPDGYFSFDLTSTGEFIASFEDHTGEQLGEFSGDTRDVAAAASFVATREEPVVLNASLAKAATITGLAVDARTGEPLENVCPDAYFGHAGDFARGVGNCSGADGRWRIGGLETGSYALRLDPSWEDDRHVSTWAFKGTSQATADLISVTVGQDKSVRDVKMALGGSVAGRITDPTGQPVAGAWVTIDQSYPGRAGPGEPMVDAVTDENGYYAVHGVPVGSHKAFVYTDDYWGPWASEWSGNALLEADAEALTVKASKTTRFDAELAPAGGISGELVTASGAPVTDLSWYGMIFAADGDYIGDFDAVGGGRLVSTSLPAGSFTLRLENSETDEVVWYDGATSQADAQRVTLGTGEHKEITFHLP